MPERSEHVLGLQREVRNLAGCEESRRADGGENVRDSRHRESAAWDHEEQRSSAQSGNLDMRDTTSSETNQLERVLHILESASH